VRELMGGRGLTATLGNSGMGRDDGQARVLAVSDDPYDGAELRCGN
jgi:hypothetical protein